jgi:hypothetical protein
MPLYHGSCHCRAVRFEIDTEITDLITCDCSICRRRSAVMAGVHESKLRITAGEDKLTLYQWNTGVARHYFCIVCGIYPFHKRRSMPDHYGVNIACLDDFDATARAVTRVRGSALT